VAFHAFVTGYPGFIAKRLVAFIAKQNPKGRLTLLVQPKFVQEATRLIARLEGAAIDVVSGDVADMHLGLAGPEYEALVGSVTHVFHLAANSSLDAPRELARKVVRTKASAFSIRPKVLFDNEASRIATVIEVECLDRPGLLYDITQAIFEAGLSISTSMVATYGERAVDVFYVRDGFGHKIVHPARLEAVEKRLKAALEAPVPAKA
jgi:UTP:GlnB (protein PII) uridylyltransferase